MDQFIYGQQHIKGKLLNMNCSYRGVFDDNSKIFDDHLEDNFSTKAYVVNI